MKKIILLSLSFCLFSAVLFAQDGPAGEPEGEPGKIGLTVGVDYWSNYLWRGAYWFNNDGAFFPSISYDVMGTGLNVIIGGELSEDWIGGDENSTETVEGRQAADFALDFSKSINNSITIGAAVWYYMMKDSANTFATGTLSVSLDKVPLAPTLTYNHDWYQESGDAADMYIQLGISHEFELTKEAALGLGLTGSYYNADSTDQSGVSDITLSAGLSVEAGAVSYTGSFNYIIVPGADFKKGIDGKSDDLHRFFASFGASYSL